MTARYRSLNLIMAFILAMGLVFTASPPENVEAISTTLVLSQFQTVGSSSADEFVEIHNISNDSIDINGYKLAYRSYNGTDDSVLIEWDTTTIIPSGGYYLIGHSLYNGSPAADVTYDFGSSGSIGAAGGGLAIRDGADTILDSLGYGSAVNAFIETARIWPTPGVSQSYSRSNNGCTDTDDNDLDFFLTDPSEARSSASTAIVCAADVAPTVTSTIPDPDATGVDVDTDISITFSEPVTLAADFATISCGTSGPHTYTVDELGDPVIELDPTSFNYNETCTVTVDHTKVTDEDGTADQMAEDKIWSFTTEADLAPTVISTVPDPDATGVAVDAGITITFSEPVTATGTWATLTCNSLPVTATLSGGGSSYIIDPDAFLPIGVSCTATILKDHITDLDGVPTAMAADHVWTFTTSNDIAPYVSSTIPTNGITGVPVGTTLAVNFSESVAVTGTWATLYCGGSQFSAELGGSGSSYSIDPHDNLPYGSSCTATVLALQVMDLDGISQNMATDFIWNFTTLYDPAPFVVAVTPISGATKVALNANLVVDFSEQVVVIGEWYTIDCATSGLHSATVTGTPALYTINPDSNFFNNELCTITIKSAQVQDEDAEDPYDFMAADYTWSFTTLQCGGPHTLISAIQGSGTTSPVVGTTGVTVEGLVTADFQGTNPGISGFYIQSLSGEADSNPLTSEGLLVYGNSIPASVGEILRLTGTVVEYRGQTELGGTVVLNETCSTGNSLPSPISLNLPDNADQTFTLEPYEGMLATFPEELTLQQNYFQGQYGQITLGAGGRIAQMNNETKAGGSPYDYTRMIILDDASSRSNPSPIPYYSADGVLRAGDTVTGLTGVIDQGPINTKTTGTIAFPLFYYRLNPTSAPGFSIANTRPVSAPDVGGTLTVAGFNTLNYFTTLDDDTNPGPYSSENRPWGAENLAEFDRQEDKLVAALAAMHADVFGLVKLESWDTAATPQALVNALNTYLAGSATYAVVPDPIFGHFDSMTDVNSDYIQVGLIYKTDTVSLVGDSLSVDDTIFDRSPFAQVFESNATGERFVVVANHFRSNDCDGSETGGDLSVFEDGQGCWNARRVLQAEALLDFIDTTLAPLDPDVLVIGDLNAYGDEDPIETLVDGGLINQVEAFVPDEDRYSYVYDGMTGYIDHFLSTGSMVGQVTGVDFFHINADEPAVIDYNNNSWKSVDLYQPHMYRSSDHDPILAGLNLLQHTLFDFMELELLGSLNGTDYSTVYGNLGDGYILPLDQNLQFQYLEAGTYLANKTLANGRYPFYLDETTVPAGFYEYWAAKHVYEGCGGTWEPIMWQIIIGNQPMFYLKVADSELTLIDGMTYLTAHVDTPLRVSGDYPLGDYDFSGIVFDKWGGSDKEDVTITFEGMPDITALELLGSTNGSDWHAAFGTIDAGYTYAINPKFVYQYLDTGTYTVNTSLVDNRYPFYLDETSVPAGFYDYWAAKNVYEGCDGTWEPIMWQIISGQAPMFYLKVAGSEYSLIDGMTFIMYATDAPLRVSGDYPLGTYTFTGTIDGIHFGKSVEEVTITFVRLNQIFMPIITK